MLGKSYGDALESQEIHLAYAAGTLTVQYVDHRFPVTPKSYIVILEHRHDELTALLAENPKSLAEYDSILTAIRHLAPSTKTDPAKIAESQREKEVIKRRLATLTDTQPAVREFIEHNVALFNGTPADPHSFDQLDTLLQAQVYRLCDWRIASEKINYRRFFDINDLAALSMEKPEVFTAPYELILRLLSEGKVHECASIILMGCTIHTSICNACSSSICCAWHGGCWGRTSPIKASQTRISRYSWPGKRLKPAAPSRRSCAGRSMWWWKSSWACMKR
jgi:maltooligosyltrehalose synthase